MKGPTAFLGLLFVAAMTLPSHGWVQAEEVIEILTPRGPKVRALLLKPGARLGSVILLAGGHGNLALGANGKIGWGAGNQLVRTRAGYAEAGFVTLVPDIAPDLKKGK